jgi:chitinase
VQERRRWKKIATQALALTLAAAVGAIAAVGVMLLQPDTSPPFVSFTHPLPGRSIAGLVEATATMGDDVGVVRAELWAGPTRLGVAYTQPYAVEFDSEQFEDGPLELRWRGIDAAGNVTVFTRQVIVDNTAPTIDFSPPRQARGILTLEVGASDDNGIERVDIKRDGDFVWSGVNLPATVVLDITAAPDKTTTIEIVAYDIAGNTTRVQHDIDIINTAPTITIQNPEEFSALRGLVGVSISVTSAVPITRTTLLVNGESVSERDGLVDSLTFDAELFSGEVSLAVEVEDTLGGIVRSTERILYIDREPPDIAFTTPLPPRISRPTTVRVAASDDSGIRAVTFAVDGEIVASSTQAPYEYTWDPGARRGRVTFTITALDRVGNSTDVTATSQVVRGR